MKYKEIVEGKFIKRRNRFIAEVDVSDEVVLCHVKNTGRLKELFVTGVCVYLERNENPKRKTAYSLIGVEKDGITVNVDSQAPNKMVKEWLEETQPEGKITVLKPECVFDNSRFDFYMETEQKAFWIEVKGVTLVEGKTALFPDAPTERGIKHIAELCEAARQGYQAMLIFVIQRKGVEEFRPNERTQPAFAKALREAEQAGVKILTYDSIITEDSAVIDKAIEVKLV
ncbi:MAG: DNA/RNA nuclease SfsA [Acetivibrio ethanolgignens]